METDNDRSFATFTIPTVGTMLLRKNRGAHRKDPRGRTSISLDAHIYSLLIDHLGGSDFARLFVEQSTRRAIVELGLNKDTPPKSKIGLSRYVMRLCVDKLLSENHQND